MSGGTLWTTRRDRRRLRAARSAVLMVGSYDGSGNFGDVLQLAGALETVTGLPGSPLAVVVVEREFLASHASLLKSHRDQLGGAVFVAFDAGGGRRERGLVELARGAAPSGSVLYLYGGGYLNDWWGERKATFSAAAERLAGGGPLPVVVSGQQVMEPAIAAGGVAHELVSRAAWVGARDTRSLEVLRANLEGELDRFVLAGDDAVPLLHFGAATPEPIVNLHVNTNHWVSDSPEAMTRRVVAILRRLGESAGGGLQLQPVIAYEDPRISEASLLAEVLEAHHDELALSGLSPIAPLDVLADATGNRLARFRRARLTVSCSYHVAFSSLLAGIPTLLLAENGYYDQKAAGLRDLFGLDPGLVGVKGSERDAAAAAEVLLDGPARDVQIERIVAGAARVVELCDRGRSERATALAEALREPWPDQ